MGMMENGCVQIRHKNGSLLQTLPVEKGKCIIGTQGKQACTDRNLVTIIGQHDVHVLEPIPIKARVQEYSKATKGLHSD